MLKEGVMPGRREDREVAGMIFVYDLCVSSLLFAAPFASINYQLFSIAKSAKIFAKIAKSILPLLTIDSLHFRAL